MLILNQEASTLIARDGGDSFARLSYLDREMNIDKANVEYVYAVIVGLTMPLNIIYPIQRGSLPANEGSHAGSQQGLSIGVAPAF